MGCRGRDAERGELLGGDKLLLINLGVPQRFQGVSERYHEVTLLRTLQGGRDIPNHHRLWMFYFSKSSTHLRSHSLAESVCRSLGMHCALPGFGEGVTVPRVRLRTPFRSVEEPSIVYSVERQGWKKCENVKSLSLLLPLNKRKKHLQRQTHDVNCIMTATPGSC